MIANLKEKSKKLPLSPGVYLMKDSTGCIIYVGKAKKLKQRVQSYFHNSNNHSPKIVKLIAQIRDFDYILTDTEFEAFMLECQLIKEIKPFFNSLMKNPLSYVYITINMNNSLPEIKITDEPVENDNFYCFGPYTNKNTVKRALEGIKVGYHLDCKTPTNQGSYCLNYTLGLCIGMCHSHAARNEYNKIIEKIIALLSGTDINILEDMKQKMETAAENYQFEAAGKWRDCIHAVQLLTHREQVIRFTEYNKRIIITEYLHDHRIKLFLIQRNKILFSKTYVLHNVDVKHIKSEIKYILCSGSSNTAAQKISRDEIDEANIVYHYLKNNSNRFFVIPDNWLQQENDRTISEKLSQMLAKE